MRLSTYNLVTDLGDGHVLLTNLLSRAVIQASEQQLALLESMRGSTELSLLNADDREFISTLARNLFLLPDEFDELEYIARMHREERTACGVKNLVIAPTMRCNMSCHYCFESRTGNAMCDSVQARLLESVAASLPKYEQLHVQWFGGEPLLEIEKIEQLSRRLQQVASAAGKDYSAEVITNGQLLTAEIAERLAAVHVVEAQVTFEGMRNFHDKVRFLDGHEATFDRLVQNISDASRYLTINVRVHVTPYNLKSVQELVDYLGEHIPKAITRLYFSPLFNYQAEGKLAQYLVDRRKFMSAQDFAPVQMELLAQAKRHGISTGDPLKASYGLCLAMLDGTEVIGPTGVITKCYLDVNVAGKAHADLKRGTEVPEREEAWTKYDFAEDDGCRSCKFLPVCLGGCPSQRMHKADKQVVCTPLKFNFHQRMLLDYGSLQ